jgi:hypothetical protein
MREDGLHHKSTIYVRTKLKLKMKFVTTPVGAVYGTVPYGTER